MPTYLVRYVCSEPVPEGCAWPVRQVDSIPPTPEELADGLTDNEPVWEAEVTAPTEHCAVAAIWGLYCGEPIEWREGATRISKVP